MLFRSKLNGMMQDTILVRLETSPEDIHGMHAAKGILTARGGMTSHAAVVARGMGRPCVSGSSEITIDYELKQFKAGDAIIKEGDVITIDGGSGKVMKGLVPTVQPEISGYFSTNDLNFWEYFIAHSSLGSNGPFNSMPSCLKPALISRSREDNIALTSLNSMP